MGLKLHGPVISISNHSLKTKSLDNSVEDNFNPLNKGILLNFLYELIINPAGFWDEFYHPKTRRQKINVLSYKDMTDPKNATSHNI